MLDFKAVLENDLVHIRPLTAEDFDALFSISSDPLLWEQHPAKERSTPEGFKKWFEDAMATDRAFYVTDKETGKPVGTSRYNETELAASAIEIGWTFIAREFWGGKYNRSLKKLMMDHAFTHYDKILFFVDKHNFRSQKAVEKLGGKRISELDGQPLGPRGETSFVYCIDRVS